MKSLNTKLIISVAYILVSLLFLQSCSKTSLDPSSINTLENKIDYLSVSENLKNGLGIALPNGNNPYDYIGKYHNVILDELLQGSFTGNKAEIEEQIKLSTNKIMNRYFPKREAFDLNALNRIPSFEGHFYNIDMEKYAQIFKQLKGVDAKQTQFITDYISECMALYLTNDNEENSRKIIAIENKFINDKGCNSDFFYITSAVFRYSLIYNVSKVDNRLEISRFWKLVIADAIGAGVGGAVGGIGGAISGAAGASSIADILLN